MLNFKKEKVNMGILSTHESKLYSPEKVEEEFYLEFMTEELLSNLEEATLDDIVEITEEGIEYHY